MCIAVPIPRVTVHEGWLNYGLLRRQLSAQTPKRRDHHDERLRTNESDFTEFGTDIRLLKTEELENVSGAETPIQCRLTAGWIPGIGPVVKIVCY